MAVVQNGSFAFVLDNLVSTIDWYGLVSRVFKQR